MLIMIYRLSLKQQVYPCGCYLSVLFVCLFVVENQIKIGYKPTNTSKRKKEDILRQSCPYVPSTAIQGCIFSLHFPTWHFKWMNNFVLQLPPFPLLDAVKLRKERQALSLIFHEGCIISLCITYLPEIESVQFEF